MSRYKPTWQPLTSEPETLSELMYDLGVERNVALLDVVDIETGLNDAIALIMIFPESTEDERRKEKEEQQRKLTNSQSLGINYFIKQNIDNACGMVAIVNAVLNSPAFSSVKSGSILDNIAKASSIEITDEMKSVYNKAVINDDDVDDSVEHHFSALVEVPADRSESCVGTHLVELDGERYGPYIRASSNGNSLRDAAHVRHVYDTLKKGSDLAGIFKLVLVDNTPLDP